MSNRGSLLAKTWQTSLVHKDLWLFACLAISFRPLSNILISVDAQSSVRGFSVVRDLVSLGLFGFSMGGLIHNGKVALNGGATTLGDGWKACKYYFFRIFLVGLLLVFLALVIFSVSFSLPLQNPLALFISLPAVAVILLLLIEAQWTCLSIVVEDVSIGFAVERIWSLTRLAPIKYIGLCVVNYAILLVIGYLASVMPVVVAAGNPLLIIIWNLFGLFLAIVFESWSTLLLIAIYPNLNSVSRGE